MKRIVKLAALVVFAFAALSANAQLIETDYPRVVPAGPVVAAATPQAPAPGESTSGQRSLYLIQSNAEGPRVDPGYAVAQRPTLTREEVQAQARLPVRWNAPDLRSSS